MCYSQSCSHTPCVICPFSVSCLWPHSFPTHSTQPPWPLLLFCGHMRTSYLRELVLEALLPQTNLSLHTHPNGLLSQLSFIPLFRCHFVTDIHLLTTIIWIADCCIPIFFAIFLSLTIYNLLICVCVFFLYLIISSAEQGFICLDHHMP